MSISRRQSISVAGADIVCVLAIERSFSRSSKAISRDYPSVKNLEQ
jgi:hypothetical protein